MKLNFKIFIIISVFTYNNYAFAGNMVSEKIKLNWNGISEDNSIEGVKISFLTFEGALLDLPSPLPSFVYQKKINTNQTVSEVILKEQNYIALTEQEKLLLNKIAIEKECKISFETKIERKEKFVSVTILPFRKNNNTIEKLTSFSIEIISKANLFQKIAVTSYASNSVLASGTWFKIGVTKDGIYKVNYNFLKTLGADVNSINPQNIRVYGNGGKQLAFLNSVPRIDDLIENPIMVEGENDSRFDSLDHFWFYAHGPHQWETSNSCSGYRHVLHGYSDTSYYFINVDIGPGLRYSSVPQTDEQPNYTVTSFDDLQFYEKEASNMRISGREFFGEKFDNQLTYNFDFQSPNIDFLDSAIVKASFLSSSNPPATFKVSCQGALKTVSPPSAPSLGSGNTVYTLDMGTEDSLCLKFKPVASNLSVQIDFLKNPLYSSGFGYLNFIELVTRRQLKLYTNQVLFRDKKSVGPNIVSKFIIGNAQANTMVLNVTNPTQAFIQLSDFSNSTITFSATTNSLNEYIAFNPNTTAFLEPFSFGIVPNQNLHATANKDMIIISHPMFLAEAERLKKMHEQKDNLKVIVVTPQQIYNEFSGGMQDLAGLRMFGKMLYDRASNQIELPDYLLLFGDASYNNRVRSTNGNTNFIPVYESAASLDLINSYCTDDFFGLLDDNESEGASSPIDIAIGRLPSKTLDEAKAMVDKILDYVSKKPLPIADANCVGCCNSEATANVNGDWRNIITLISDDEDSNLHLGDAESNATIINAKAKQINIEKIYLDTYKQITDAGGQRYPDVNTAFNERMNKGALIINYSGHGGEVGWAAERVLGVDDIKKWKNKGRYPFFVTATCEFTRYDDPARTSAGELTILQSDGGGIALATTTRLVYQSANKALNNTFYNILFDRDSTLNTYKHFGEVLRLVKNNSSVAGTNARKFALMGDPALTLDFPEYKVNTVKVEVLKDTYTIDTLKALSKVKVTGFVCDKNNTKLNNFSGLIYPTIYDKSSIIKTLGNDGGSSKVNVGIRKSIIYKGKVSVTKGNFSFEFIVPKDIAYQYGSGRISYYAESDATDATGFYENFLIGGVNQNAPTDNAGPTVKLFMNDDKFISGSLTNENPKLIAIIEDENGVNTVGNGIGHDISAVLDGKTDKSITLNDYYQSELNSYQKGNVLYGFNSLSEGPHNVKFKVWDVYNNSSDASIDFVVAKTANLALNHVLNYPNPFTTNTTFMFEHNKPCQNLEVQIQIFSVSGKLVKSIIENIPTTGFRSEDIHWDGLDDYGDKIGKGVYVYKLKVTATDGTIAEQLEKLVLLN